MHQTISASLIGAELASKLKVEPGSPALAMQHTYRLSNHQVAQVTISVHPATRYRLPAATHAPQEVVDIAPRGLSKPKKNTLIALLQRIVENLDAQRDANV
jgi:hypothetical protein